jgi:hexosaminidase
MMGNRLLVFLVGIASAGCSVCFGTEVLPKMRQWSSADSGLVISSDSRIVVREDDARKLTEELKLFRQDLKARSQIDISIKKGDPKAGDIHIQLDVGNTELGREGYELVIDKFVKIRANAPGGVFYGMQTVLQMLGKDGSLSCGSGIDYPLIRQRGLMVDCGRKYFEVDYLERLMRQMAYMKLNMLHLHFTEWNGFRLESEVYPGLASDQAYSKSDIRRLQDVAEKYHMVIVPEIDLPAHATWMTRYNSELAFKSESMRKAKWQGDEANAAGYGWCIDMTRKENREWIARLLDEWIPLFDGPYFHIGGDEWQYDEDKYNAPELVKAMKERGYEYPGDVFVEWINEINQQVKSYGKTTQIWNWWNFSPNKTKKNVTSIHPDKDVVVNIWNRPREKDILDAGYPVVITHETGKSALYVTPFEGTKKIGDYGVFNPKRIYEQWIPIVSDQVLGYKVCLWTNDCEDKPDNWFNQFFDLPLAVFAERGWVQGREESLEVFESKRQKIGVAPGLEWTTAPYAYFDGR